MLSLHTPTAARWLAQVDAGLDEILVDHAHCEKKAAGVAMNLLFSYVDHAPLARAMTEIVNEELEHFRLVLDLLERRGIPFRKLSPSSYGPRLHERIRKEEPAKAVDRLLVAGLIEARSCERFSVLADHVTDAELRDFYRSLFEAEARHHATYVRAACDFATDREVTVDYISNVVLPAGVSGSLSISGPFAFSGNATLASASIGGSVGALVSGSATFRVA